MFFSIFRPQRYTQRAQFFRLKECHLDLRNDVRQIVYIYHEKSQLNRLVWGWLTLAPINLAAFRIIGLTKISNTEFLPLDWLYCSIRIMTVIYKFRAGSRSPQLV